MSLSGCVFIALLVIAAGVVGSGIFWVLGLCVGYAEIGAYVGAALGVTVAGIYLAVLSQMSM